MTSKTTLLDLAWQDILCERILPYLSLTDCYNLRAASKSCCELVDLYFGFMKDLNVSQYKSFNEAAFKVLANNCRKLQRLNISKCSGLNDNLLISLFENNRNLVRVSMCHCRVSPLAFHTMTLSCKQLRVLKLAGCDWLSSGSVETFALHQRRLEEVDLSSCCHLSEPCLIAFLSRFRKLRVLNLARIQAVTDETLYAAARHCRFLEHLNLRGCWRITDNGIRIVGEYCSLLQTLMVDNCVNVTERSLAPLRRRMAVDKVNFVHYYLVMEDRPPMLMPYLQI